MRGRLGKVSGGLARVYNSRAQTFAILKRDPHATPVLDVLTYYVDLMCWFLEGNPPIEVVARGQPGSFLTPATARTTRHGRWSLSLTAR